VTVQAEVVGGELRVSAPRWLAASLDVKEGRDPLGLQTTTQDRLMPRLLPGILELSRRARYFSFHCYLLDRYRELRLPAEAQSLSTFIKAREWEYGLAVLSCPHECGSVPVGAQRLRGVVGHQDPPYPRGESVESPFGGYGLYYRSPLADLGIVARSGTLLGDSPIPIDVLYNTGRARKLADTFREAVDDTEYIAAWMLTTDPIPIDVLVDYARVGCLCQLAAHPDERDAVHDALFGDNPVEAMLAAGDPDAGPLPGETDTDAEDSLQLAPELAVTQRRRSVAHYLTIVDADPAVVDDESAFREALWAPTVLRSPEHERVAGEWAALVAKDVWQEALCSIWSEFCRAGVGATRAREGEGLSWEETQGLARAMTSGPPDLDPAMPTTELAAAVLDGSVGLPGVVDGGLPDAALEALRGGTVALDTGASGMVVLLEFYRRARDRTDPGWVKFSAIRSAWQPSVATVLHGVTAHLAEGPTVADTLWWLVHHFVLGVHERIAYSKLPEHTFRFRWEDGRVRFYENGIGRFPLAAVRNVPLAMITHDLAFWEREGDVAALTGAGRGFIAEMLP
jgi:hypothetical protein